MKLQKTAGEKSAQGQRIKTLGKRMRAAEKTNAINEYDPYKPVFDAAEALMKRDGLPNIGAVFQKAMELKQAKHGPLPVFDGVIVKTNPRRSERWLKRRMTAQA